MEVATTQTFDVIVAEHPTVVVDFHAPWCGPCKAMEPILKTLDGNPVPIIKVDIDAETDLGVRFGVRGVPTFMILHKGDVAASKVGTMTASTMKRWIDENRGE